MGVAPTLRHDYMQMCHDLPNGFFNLLLCTRIEWIGVHHSYLHEFFLGSFLPLLVEYVGKFLCCRKDNHDAVKG